MWPFGCKGCKAKDSEIAFHRQILSSMRSIVRDPSQEPERRQQIDYSLLEGLAGLAKRDQGAAPGREEETPGPSIFSRNPIQNFIPQPSDDDETLDPVIG